VTLRSLPLCLVLFVSAGCAPLSDKDDDGSGGDGAPDDGYCDDVADWDAEWAALEEDVLDIVNENRESGASCGAQGSFGPADPLTMDAALRCAARKHSKDMNDRDFFDHTNPSGEDPFDRIDKTGYEWVAAGENIAAGSPDAEGTMAQWMGSDVHCANIMSPDFEEIGVGYHPGGPYDHSWTQVFATPF